MGTLTPTAVQFSDLPMDTEYGTGTRLRLCHIIGPALSAGSTVALTTYDPSVVDVVGIVCETDGGAVEGTASTWSTYTITISSGAAGVYEGTFLVRTTE